MEMWLEFIIIFSSSLFTKLLKLSRFKFNLEWCLKFHCWILRFTIFKSSWKKKRDCRLQIGFFYVFHYYASSYRNIKNLVERKIFQESHKVSFFTSSSRNTHTQFNLCKFHQDVWFLIKVVYFIKKQARKIVNFLNPRKGDISW